MRNKTPDPSYLYSKDKKYRVRILSNGIHYKLEYSYFYPWNLLLFSGGWAIRSCSDTIESLESAVTYAKKLVHLYNDRNSEYLPVPFPPSQPQEPNGTQG